MKAIGIVIILGILFSYLPAFPMDDCQETAHAGTMQLHCGYVFHCPFLSNPGFLGPVKLPYLGRIESSSLPMRVDEFVMPVYHPPENPV